MSSDSDSRKIFVGGLSLNTTQQMLSAYFSSFGAIEDAIVMTDKITGRPRGFGFVTFKEQDAVEKVLLEAHSIDGRTVECKRAVPLDQQGGATSGVVGAYGSATATGMTGGPGAYGSQGPSMGRVPAPPATGTLSQRAVQSDANLAGEDSGYNPKKIFAGGLPASCDEAKLRQYFSKYGGIVDCVVMIDRVAQRHRGFGYVTFEDPKSVDQCMAEHDSHQIDGKWIDVKRCVIQDPAQRKQQGYPTQAAGPIRRRTDGVGYGVGSGYGNVSGGYGASAGYGVSPAGAGGAAAGYDGSSGYYYNAPPAGAGYAAYGYGAAYGAAGAAGATGYGQPAGAAAYGAGGAGSAMYAGYGAAAAARPGLYTGPAGAASGMARPGAPAGSPGAVSAAQGYARPGATPGAPAGGYGAAYYGGNPYHYAQAAAGYGAAPGGYAGYGGARPAQGNDGGYGVSKQPSSPGARGSGAPY